MNAADIVRYLKNHANLTAETLPEASDLVRRYPWFSAGWALYLGNLKALGKQEFDELLAAGALRVADRRWLKRYLEQGGPADALRRHFPPSQLQVADYPLTGEDASHQTHPHREKLKLIDIFLSGGASFQSMPKGDSPSPATDLAEKAVAESDDIVTETYVNLLIDQKKYENAIRALKKLSLKYPEKSIYFAGRIEVVNNLMNQ